MRRLVRTTTKPGEKMSRTTLLLFLLLFLCGACVLLPTEAFSQAAAPVQAPSSANPANEGQDEQRIRIRVEEVQIPFSVFDKKGALALDLKKDDFKVYEDGVEQQIRYFSAPTNLPLRFGILIDTSSSTRPRLKFEKEAAMSLGYYVLTHNKTHQGF